MPTANTMVWILGEIIFVLLVLCIFLFLLIIKLKKSQKLLQTEYRELRKRTRHIINELDYSEANPIPDKLHGDPVGIFLHSISQYSLSRFNKFVPAGLPHLTPDTPLGAKIAALRYMFAVAETENRTKQNNPENWLSLEKRLIDIARWVKSPSKQPNRSGSRVRQLQESLDALRKHEAENSRLKRQLTYAREKNQTLEKENKEGKNNIRKMQGAMNAFQDAIPHGGPTYQPQQTDADIQAMHNKRHERADSAYRSGVTQVSTMATISQRKQDLVQQIHEASSALKYLSPDEKSKFALQISDLETDILKSDHHITALQRELKSARENIATLKIENDTNNDSLLLGPDARMEVVRATSPSAEENISIDPSWLAGGGHERTIEEIENLRNNNQNQRKTIIELEHGN